MRLENLLALTHGKLINEPFVNSFLNIVFDIKSLKRGDLFIAFDEEMIEEAVLSGAYGILFDKPTQISDSEIAWIKVNSLEDALKRLLRFRLIEKEVVAYKCNEITLKLALQIITEPSFVAISGDMRSLYNSLWEIDTKSIVLFSPTLSESSIFTDVRELPRLTNTTINMIEKTLFETSFIYDDIFYERQLISPFFMPYLNELLNLFKSQKINFRLRKFTPIEHFEAVFTNKNLELKEFGASDKVLIFEKNTSLIKSEIEYLQKNATWAKIIYILPFLNSNDFIDDENCFAYKNEKDIRAILQENHFHFALIVGVNKSFLDKPIPYQTQLTLF